jgi:hypothetical protein
MVTLVVTAEEIAQAVGDQGIVVDNQQFDFAGGRGQGLGVA